MVKQLGINQIGRFDYSPLIAGDFDVVTIPVMLKAGKVYKRGSVLAYEDDTGLCDLVDSAIENGGLDKPYAVLAGYDIHTPEVDATEENTSAVAYVTGEFAREFLIFGGTDTWETHVRAARDVGMFFRKTATAPNQ